MMRKSTLASIIVISVLMFYTGCGGGGDGGDGDGDDGGSPTPGVSPTPGTEGCNNCPCDFFSVPMTDECWPEPEFLPEEAGETPLCMLSPSSSFFGFALAIIDENQCSTTEGNGCCVIYPYEQLGGDCQTPVGIAESLLSNQVEDCRTCLEEYATALNDSGITVTGGPPYICIGP